MKKTALLLCALFVLGICHSFAQTLQISGRVTSQTTNEPLVGASVVVKGTNTATTTDAQGNYSIAVPKAGSTLVVTYTGMTAQEQVVRSSGTQNFSVVSANNTLNEVIVNVGYGTQKKSVTTGAISSVRSKDLENVPNGRLEQTLQGRVSGVLIGQNAGQPGSASTVRVRGVTTFGNNNPLYVVDGIVIDPGAIGYINQSDIESIEVLKDATSAAIYGTRAATGVILITTKKGRAGKFTASYNVFVGTAAPEKKLDLLNATEYATLVNERRVAGGDDIKFTDPASLGTGTDWQDQIFNNNAKRSNHELSLSGGNDKSTFYISLGLQDQEGIVATDISHYNKKTFRLNSTHKISKVFTIGQTFGYSHQNSRGLGNTNSEFGGPLSSAINLDPITPVFETDPALNTTGNYSQPNVIRNAAGVPYGISNNVGQEMSNPAAYILTRLGNYNWSDDFIGNAFVEVSPISKLKFRSTFGGKIAYWGDYGFTPAFFLTPSIQNQVNSIGKSTNNTFNWTLENTVQYGDKIGDHDFSVLLGQGAYVDNNGGGSNVSFKGIPVNDYQVASFGFPVTAANTTAGAYTTNPHKVSSLFGRVNYNYQEKYLFTGIIRRDGSTRFGSNKKFGVFPSASLGWVVSKENFWTPNSYVNNLKIRGGYGKVGNDQLDDFKYLSTVAGGFNYTFGNAGLINTGYAPRTLDNPDLHWEETSQLNIGFDAQVFQNFTVTMEVFNKKTTGILRDINIPGYVGVAVNPSANVADMKNEGLELELGYRKTFAGGVAFGANGNVSFLKNTVTYVAADANYIVGDASFQSMGAVTRTQVGQSYNSFYGYKTAGIFQTQADVLAYTDKNGGVIQPNAKPGDFRWVDTNGDGKISEDDKQFLGTNIPKVTFGLTLNASWKGFDMMVFGQGAAGNKIFQGLRRLDIQEGNWQKRALTRWTGPGTSNDYPRLTSKDDNGNFSNMSDFYLEKGDYLRLKVVQIGYTYTNSMLTKLGASKLRLYVTAENLATLTKYTGYDPEIGGGVFGVDKGYYPQARSFIVGAQIVF